MKLLSCIANPLRCTSAMFTSNQIDRRLGSSCLKRPHQGTSMTIHAAVMPVIHNRNLHFRRLDGLVASDLSNMLVK